MEALLSVGLGLGLSAACGFRVFVPLLFIGIAARTDHLTLAGGFDWMGSTPALITFGVATVLEVAAYYVPWVDNFLDTIATPAAVVAGVVASASVVTGMDPYLKWTLAVIAGGGVAGAIQGLTAGARQVSSLTTGGLANPVVSSAELGGSVALSGMSIVAPLLAAAIVAGTLLLLARWVARRRRAAWSPAGSARGSRP